MLLALRQKHAAREGIHTNPSHGQQRWLRMRMGAVPRLPHKQDVFPISAIYVPTSVSDNVCLMSSPCVSPQDYLNHILQSRGYRMSSASSSSRYSSSRQSTETFSQVNTMMVDAILYDGDIKAVQRLLDRGVSIPWTVQGDLTAHALCRRGDVELLKFLLDTTEQKRIATNGPTTCSPLMLVDRWGSTVLHEACGGDRGILELVEFLLDGVDDPLALLCATDNAGYTPLQYVPEQNWPQWKEILSLLQEKYCPVSMSIGDNEDSRVSEKMSLSNASASTLCTDEADTPSLQDTHHCP